MGRARSAVVAVTLVIVLVAMPSGAEAGSRPKRVNAVVTGVVDGDTIHVDVTSDGRLAGEQTVRFIGIDTPEVHNPNTPRECFGRVATRRVEQLIPEGTRIRLVLDVEERDRYGRLLAYVYRRSDRLFVNASLVRDGFAAVYTVPPNVAHAEDFRRLQRAARRRSLGLWSTCGGPDKPA